MSNYHKITGQLSPSEIANEKSSLMPENDLNQIQHVARTDDTTEATLFNTNNYTSDTSDDEAVNNFPSSFFNTEISISPNEQHQNPNSLNSDPRQFSAAKRILKKRKVAMDHNLPFEGVGSDVNMVAVIPTEVEVTETDVHVNDESHDFDHDAAEMDLLESFLDQNSSINEKNGNYSSNILWTKKLDDRLRQAVELHNNDWPQISESLGINGPQCFYRWHLHLNRLYLSDLVGIWTAEEDEKLRTTVSQIGSKNWLNIASMVGRKGRSKQCFYRWRCFLDPALSFGKKGSWTEEEDQRLKEGFDQFGRRWAKVAEYVGGGVSNIQCLNRWKLRYDPRLNSITTEKWTEDEINQLEQLVLSNRHDPTLRLSGVKRNRDTVNWKIVGEALNRSVRDCMHKWTVVQNKYMKKGQLTEEEQQKLEQKVIEWEKLGKSKGLWSWLQNEMNRPAATLRKHWLRKRGIETRDRKNKNHVGYNININTSIDINMGNNGFHMGNSNIHNIHQVEVEGKNNGVEDTVIFPI